MSLLNGPLNLPYFNHLVINLSITWFPRSQNSRQSQYMQVGLNIYSQGIGYHGSTCLWMCMGHQHALRSASSSSFLLFVLFFQSSARVRVSRWVSKRGRGDGQLRGLVHLRERESERGVQGLHRLCGMGIPSLVFVHTSQSGQMPLYFLFLLFSQSWVPSF